MSSDLHPPMAAMEARRHRLLGYGWALAILVPLLGLTLLSREYQHSEERAQARAQVLSEAVEKQLQDRMFLLARQLDAHMLAVAQGHPPADPAAATIPMTEVRVAAADHAGPGAGGDGLVIGAPVLRAGHGYVPVARVRHGLRIQALVGGWLFTELVDGYSLGVDDVIDVLGADGVLLARSGADGRAPGALFAPEHRANRSGRYIARDPGDGIERHRIYRRLQELPLTVVVGIGRRGLLAPWGLYLLEVLGLSALLGLSWAWLVRRFEAGQGRQMRLIEHLRRLIGELNNTEARLRQGQSLAGIGDWHWNLQTDDIEWDLGLPALEGGAPHAGALTPEELFAKVHPDDRAGLHGFIAQLRSGGSAEQVEFRVVAADGSIRHIHARGEFWAGANGDCWLRGVQQDVTALAEARERLNTAEAQYRFMFENNPLPMWVFDRQTLKFLAVNDAMLAHYGYDREELLAGDILQIRPGHDREAVRRAVRQTAAQHTQGRVWTHKRRDGSLLRAAIYGRDITFEGHDARLVLAKDVTERERNEQRFQLIARATSDAVYDWDLGAGNMWWSESFYALFGYTHETMAPTIQAWEALLHPDDRARVSASLAAAIASKAHEWAEAYRFRRADGSWADVTDRGLMQRNAQGQVVRIVGGMLDVTERHRDQADLRLLRRAVEATDNGIVITDASTPDQPVVYVNRAFEQITGYTAAEVLGRNCRLLQLDDREQPPLEAVRQALREEREVRVLLRNYRKDGELFWNEFHLAPVPGERGGPGHFVGVLVDVSERQRYEEQLAYRATHDELTGLPNRQLLQDRLQQAILNAERYGRKAAVIFIDLDEFKLVNDSLGHSAGDAALRTVAQRLRVVVRDTDTVGRFGGDEFVVVLTEQTDDASILPAIARITAALSQPMEIAGVTHSLTPSIGWCHYPDAGSDAESLLMHADMAMYQAKQQGRNRAVAYHAAFDASVSQRLQLVSRLRMALQREEIVLHFQPVFDPAGRPVALEALARWQHPERGLLLPAHFIPVCEESGLIVELGRRVLREAARHHCLLAAAGLGGLRIAVNVSAVQFAQDLAVDVEAVMREFALPPGVLELELTESAIMADPEHAIEAMQRIAAMGVSISVDDFGTGYSSLSYLKRLPIERLKIDRSFVQDLGNNPDDAAICTAIIGMARSLDLGIVAEGVETHQQLEWLHARGCDEIQGFLLGRPQPFESLLSLLVVGNGRPVPAA